MFVQVTLLFLHLKEKPSYYYSWWCGE